MSESAKSAAWEKMSTPRGGFGLNKAYSSKVYVIYLIPSASVSFRQIPPASAFCRSGAYRQPLSPLRLDDDVGGEFREIQQGRGGGVRTKLRLL